MWPKPSLRCRPFGTISGVTGLILGITSRNKYVASARSPQLASSALELQLHIHGNIPDTGRYSITNVKVRNLAVLLDANDESDIVAGTDVNDASEKWNVTLLNNKRYTIKNHGFSNFAGCDTRPTLSDRISGRSRTKQWIIKETRIKGQFTISPTDADLVWGLQDGETSTPITLAGVPTDAKNQWILTKASV
ncbi:hypothetical protein C8R44DRAFT_396185 [Mycena epipterygia]|nr:hypothetical protein C8R44DRAFT_396185 [Mycena epipterygia]